MTQTTPSSQDTGVSAASGPSMSTRIGRVAAASAGALVVGELITLVQTVALARLLSPAEIGIFVSGTVITAFLAEFVEGGLRAGLVQREHDVADTAETVFWATLFGGVISSLGALAAAPVIGMLFNSTTAGLIAAASSGSLLLFSLTNVPESMLQREFSVKRRLIVGPTVSVAYAGTAVTLAALGCGVWSLVIGSYASFLAWVISVWAITDWRPGRGRASYRLWRELARYGLPLVLGAIGARLQNAAETLIVGRGLTSAALGNFRYGQRISQIPVRAIIEIGAVSLFPAFSRMAGDQARMRAAYLRAMRWVTIGAAPLCGMMIALGEPAVIVVFGEPWRDGGMVVMAMAGLGLGKAFISVSEEVIKATGRTRLLNWYTAVEVSVGIGSLVALVAWLGLVGAGLAMSVTALVVGLTVIGLALPLLAASWSQIAHAVIPPLPAAAVATVAVWLLDRHVVHAQDHPIALSVVMLMLDSVAFIVVYLAVLSVTAPHSTAEAGRAVVRLVARRGDR
ncbi:oligosaccharide flippase family protein [Williamsia sp. CHRR-6]|uniref:oligosaccharide flippase family protein n=1 Tax=Williamsia sp. CHRR-6 TaxID=2835871 RepID=UPI001BD9A93D|nr:oligosaccharide flippase family protein [Williamsia sp. CHRR-6]MBT0566284.1 oligosaccharide flippase family protein [Williamsia sp. CHRR-6]